MQTKKNWQLLALILPLHLYGLGSAVEFEQCIHTLNNSPCNMTCKVPDFDELIEFTCNGTTRGSCSLFLCDSNMIKEGNDTMQLQLTALSYSDNCRWICTYNGIPSSPSDVKIYSGVNVRPVLTIKKTADEVELKATAECIYPYNPTVVVQYKDQNGGDYMFLSDQTLLRISNVSENCSSDIEKTITAIYIVSGEQYARLRGKSVLFKMTFTQYPSAISVSSNEIEFSFQDCKLVIRLCGSLPVSLCELITSIVIIILLILKKEPFFKHFGELTKKKVFKVCIIVAFIVVAIIIGLCLGLLIEGICDNIPLALSLSFAFAILLAVALFVSLFFYHKFESKKGSSRNK